MHPCFSDPSDFCAMGAAETTVELDGGADVTLGFVVPRPFGPGTDAVLTIHGNHREGTHGVAIADSVEFDIAPAPKKPAMDLNLLSGAKRPESDDGGDEG